MKPMTKESVKEHVLMLDKVNGTDYHNSIDWDNPSTELPDFLKSKEAVKMTDTIVKEFSYTSRGDVTTVTLTRSETPDTETGITWIVSRHHNGSTAPDQRYDFCSVAEMDFKNAVLEALNSNTMFYTYSAER